MKTISCAKIGEDLLKSFGGELIHFNEKEIIFKQGDQPLFYYQIVKGKVKENNYSQDGKEFIHNILGDEQSLGDSMLFVDKKYPINAETLQPTTIIKLPKQNFLKLLEAHHEISIQISECMSQRLYFQTLMLQNLASNDPVIRLTGLLEYLKSFHSDDIPSSFEIHLTRQQIADLTGLRVETVIRAFKKMEQNQMIKIDNRKIFY
jgi:CRP-like cAMP-binding protein